MLIVKAGGALPVREVVFLYPAAPRGSPRWRMTGRELSGWAFFNIILFLAIISTKKIVHVSEQSLAELL